MATDDLQNRFRYHAPDETRGMRHERVRNSIGQLADQLDGELPDGREKSLVMTNLEQAMFWANAAIARQQ